MGEIRYSIVIPTKNRVKLCQRLITCIDKSILFSRIDKRLFELIIVDDSGIKHNYMSRLLGPVILVNKEKHNAAYSRNRGARIAKGEYIIFMDDDIIIPKDYFKILDKLTKKYDFDILGCRVYPMTKKARDIFFSLIFVQSRRLGFLSSINLIIKKRFFSKINFDDNEEIAPIEDYKYFFDIINNNPIIYYSRKLSVTHETLSIRDLIKRIVDYSNGFKKVYNKYKLNSLNPIYKNHIKSLDDDVPLSERYKKLSFIIKLKLRLFLLLTFIILLAYNFLMVITNLRFTRSFLRGVFMYGHPINHPNKNIFGSKLSSYK